MRRSRSNRFVSLQIVFAGLAAFVAAAGAARADLKPNQVLLVINDSSAISTAVGNYYTSIRNIPAQNILHLPAGTPSAEYISRTDYNTYIRNVVKNYLQTTVPSLKTQIKCILLTKEVPLIVANTTGGGTSQTIASVDSELTQLFTGLVPDNGQEGWLTNPYFGQTKGIDEFTNAGISYLVCRLDGYADAIDPGTGVPVDVKNLIDRAQTPTGTGVWLLDGDPTKTGGYAAGETWLNNAATYLTNMGLVVSHDSTTTFQKNVNNIIGYSSWGSNDSNNLGVPYYGTNMNGGPDNVPGTFKPGSLATDFVSTSGRTFTGPNIGNYGQSLIADLIRMGCTAANGHVAEPYLTAVSEPDQVFPNYARGMTVAEAFYTSIPFLSWENVVVCDPLMRKMQVTSQITAVSNNFGKQAGNIQFTITGKNFSTLGDTAVTVGGISATVTSVNATTIICKSPASASPGPKSIVVANSSGNYNAPAPYYYTPAIDSAMATVAIGQNYVFTIYGQHFQDYWDLIDGTLAAFPYNAPPYGDFWLDLNLPISEILIGQMPFTLKNQTITIAVPNDPNLQGTQHDLQAIVGGGLLGTNEFFFTNVIHINVQ
ncbi:MAG: TIGR03790 family protein [Planctomycetes bacterium]|nr:TIGR03790 family protein [Planctomycetota bacterium]